MALQEIDPVSENDRPTNCIDNYLEAAQACDRCATAGIHEGDEGFHR